MAKTALVPNLDENLTKDEIPDPPPEENNLTSTTPMTSPRLAMRVQDEIPDPPPEENN